MNIEYILLTQLLLISILLLKSFFKSFANEKGKNLATKQDIHDITSKIEEAKMFYSVKLESVRASLQVNVYEQNKIIEKSIDTLLEFYEITLTLVKDNLSRNLGEYPAKNIGVKLLDFQNQTQDLFIKHNILFHKLLVFLANDEIIILNAAKLSDTLQTNYNLFKEHFTNRKLSLMNEIKAIDESPESYHDAVEQSNNFNNEYFKAAKPLLFELDNDLKIFIKGSIDYLQRKNIG